MTKPTPEQESFIGCKLQTTRIDEFDPPPHVMSVLERAIVEQTVQTCANAERTFQETPVAKSTPIFYHVFNKILTHTHTLEKVAP